MACHHGGPLRRTSGPSSGGLRRPRGPFLAHYRRRPATRPRTDRAAPREPPCHPGTGGTRPPLPGRLNVLRFGQRQRARARKINNDATALVAGRPQRFGLLAWLPMPDVSEAVTEAARWLDELGADGVVLLANARQLPR